MSKMFVVSEWGRLKGIFTQKKKLWEALKLDKEDLSIMLDPDKQLSAPLTTCDKMGRYLTARGILQVYDTDDCIPGQWGDHRFIIWTIEPNEIYKPNIPALDEDGD